MATLLLGAAASALVGATGASGIVASAITAAGTVAGSLIDSFLFSGGGGSQSVEGQRLESLQVLSSAEGVPVPLVAGFARVSGQVIWATSLEEEVRTDTQKQGGKGGGGGVTTTTTTYSYFASFAVGICEGPISEVLRVWADGRELDVTKLPVRIYKGTEDQAPDSFIEAKQGTGNAPAYRGLAYVVFERLPLADFGNRIPQLTFEVIRSVGYEETMVPGMCLIPGSTEFGYSPDLVEDKTGDQTTRDNNRHTKVKASDWHHSMDVLQSAVPSVKSVALVVTWFGTDLRCGECAIEPRIEAVKGNVPVEWTVAGLTRETATIVSYVDGKPAFGGSPDDGSVIKAIQDLKARGFHVLLYPFIMMDVPAANGLPDPYGRAEQPVYPWRGRITCHPAAGQPGTVDKTGAAAAQVASFMNSGGGTGWSYRRFILHLAEVAKSAGGVDSFCIGTEMPGLSTVRGPGNAFPFVDGLVTLLQDVRAVLGSGVKLGYAADWSEYHSHRPADGSGDVFFHMDPLWSHPDLDFIGIDNYLPLADWRDEPGHLDHSAAHQSIHDLDYLKSNIEGGEYYDWYYASDADRDSQTRTPISDGAHGEDWVFRQKDIRGWWQSVHRNRPGGVRQGAATGWTPQSKPIWFTEFGCPAIDKGANQPNVFFDPKSSESFVPHFSSGARDDLVQRRYLRAMVEYWSDGAGNNPVSGGYAGRMLDTSKLFAWAWDVRPFPSFPVDAERWADHANFLTGHWLSGRFGGAPADGLARLLFDRSGLVEGQDYSTEGFAGVADGFIIDNVTSARSVLETLGAAFFFDAVESGGVIAGRSRRSRLPVLSLDRGALVDQGKNGEAARVTRSQLTELPRVVRLTAYDGRRDFQTVTGEGLLAEATSDRVVVTDVPIVADYDRVQAWADALLLEAWAGRESFTFAVPPSCLALEPGDVVALDYGGRVHLVRIGGVADGAGRSIKGKSYDGPVYEPARGLGRVVTLSGKQPEKAKALGVFIDGPLLRDDDNPQQGYVTGYRLPFAPGLAFLSSPGSSGYTVRAALDVPGTIGETLTALGTGPLYRWDNASTLDVKLFSGALQSLPDDLVLAGGNPLLVQAPSGDWEVLQYARAVLIGERTYRLSRLLRGQRGSEAAMGAAPGARVVVPTGGIAQSGLPSAQVGLPLNWQVGPSNGVVGSEDFTAYQVTMTGRGARPLSPVHCRAARVGGGAIRLSWIRRTRIGGDGWEQPDVPLGEESEAFEVEIWSGGTLRRTLTTQAQEILYTAADQAADFGSAAGAFTFLVFQLSTTYGWGTAGTGDYTP